MDGVSPIRALAGAAGFSLAGAGLGFLYFYALWMTVRKLPRLERPRRAAALSFAARAAVVLSGFYAAALEGGPWNVLALALGFALARGVLIRRAVSSGEAPS
ncbi:MAG: N-ATPase subunit AtpR [Candidatus Nitrospinota bacterium M3_3B_026]